MTHILLVEDDAATRERLERILVDAGWSTAAAATGNEAIQLFARHRPRLAVVNVEIPCGEGAETVSRLRWQRKDVAVIAVTRGPVAPAVLMTAWACGAYQILIGPVAAEELVAAVRRALEQPPGRSSPPALGPETHGGSPEPFSTFSLRWERIRRRF